MRAAWSVGTCRLAVDPATVVLSLHQVESLGYATQPLPLPNMASLLGATLFVQAVHYGPPTAFGGFALSAGYRLAIGD